VHDCEGLWTARGESFLFFALQLCSCHGLLCGFPFPHAGEENYASVGNIAFTRGPSPRAWGEHTASGDRDVAGRTIPTRVGRTLITLSLLLLLQDHPHARGENMSGGGRPLL